MKNRDTKIVRGLCFAMMALIMLWVLHKMAVDMDVLLNMPTYKFLGMVASLIVTETGLVLILQGMEDIEEAREENHRG